MRPTVRFGLVNGIKPRRRAPTYQWRQHCRSVATHTSSYYASALSVLPTKVDTSSTDFKENAARFDGLMTSIREIHEKITLGGPQKAREKHLARGKMLPREYVAVWSDSCADNCHRSRVTALIDPGTPFLELSTLAGQQLYPGEDVPAGGIITGVGSVQGVSCVIVANDSTCVLVVLRCGTWLMFRRVKGGTYYPITVKKHLRAQAIAQENRMNTFNASSSVERSG